MKRRSGFGWLTLLVGILFVILGIYTFINPDTALGGVVLAYGILAIITGIVDIYFYIQLRSHTGFWPVITLVAGIFGILAGGIIIFNPSAGAWAMTILFPIWFIAHCIVRLCNIGFTKLVAGKGMYYFSLVINLLGLVLGVLLIFNPMASALAMVYLVGIYLVLVGIESILLAFSDFGAKRDDFIPNDLYEV